MESVKVSDEVGEVLDKLQAMPSQLHDLGMSFLCTGLWLGTASSTL